MESLLADGLVSIAHAALELLALTLLLIVGVETAGLGALRLLVTVVSFVAIASSISHRFVLVLWLLRLLRLVTSLGDDHLGWLGRLLLGAKLLSVATLRATLGRVGRITLGSLRLLTLLESLNTLRVKIILVIVDGLDVEASCVVGLEGGKTALSLDLEGAGLTLLKCDVDVLLLADRVKIEGCVVAAAASVEGAESLSHHGVRVRA